MSVTWLDSGKLSNDIDDHLAIVKARTTLPLDWVLDFVPKDMFYCAQRQHRHGTGSKWKDGYVGERQHITVQLGLYPNGFPDRAAFYDFVSGQVDQVGPIDDLTVTEAVSWTPPPGCVADGDLNYRCVVLVLSQSPKVQALRNRLRASIPGFDRYGATPKFHVTVAYICDPLDRVDETEKMADALVGRLNEMFRGKSVPVCAPAPDDNQFAFYGSSRPLTSHLVQEGGEK